MKLRNGFLGIGLLLTVGMQSGCMAAIFGGGALAGAGALAYSRGDVSVVEHVNVSEAWAATLAAMDDLSITIVSRENELRGRALVAWRDDKRVRVRLGPQDNGSTEIRVRVGLFGDKRMSWQILKQIHDRL